MNKFHIPLTSALGQNYLCNGSLHSLKLIRGCTGGNSGHEQAPGIACITQGDQNIWQKKNYGNDNGHDFDFAPKQVVVGRKSLPVTLKLKPWRQLLRGTSGQK